jgi:hypothetical protein
MLDCSFFKLVREKIIEWNATIGVAHPSFGNKLLLSRLRTSLILPNEKKKIIRWYFCILASGEFAMKAIELISLLQLYLNISDAYVVISLLYN